MTHSGIKASKYIALLRAWEYIFRDLAKEGKRGGEPPFTSGMGIYIQGSSQRGKEGGGGGGGGEPPFWDKISLMWSEKPQISFDLKTTPSLIFFWLEP